MLITGLAGVISPVAAQSARPTQKAYDSAACPSCAEWNTAHAPVRIHGNSYYVGTAGLGAVLITSSSGHVLIDAGLPESATHIIDNVRALGFKVEDIRLILNSHAHYDHAGGIAEVARLSGAIVAASTTSAATMRTGRAQPDDPQVGVALAYPAVPAVRVIQDGDTLRVGSVAVAAHFTPGHTSGGTTWSWRSCEGATCLELVYADSQTPVSDDTFRYSGDGRYPNAAADLRRSAVVLTSLRCDILITPHPGASSFWERIAARTGGGQPALVDPLACTRYAEAGKRSLDRRLQTERSKP